MKIIQASLKCVAMFALLILGTSCASELQSKKDIAIAAGFKVITPVKPEHVALLPTLPRGQISEIKHEGKPYYILPDADNNQAYVGGPAEYQSYEKLRLAKKISEDNLAAAQMNQMAAMNSMNWGAWGGWGTMGYPYGGRYHRMGPYYR
jgi:hypothetical protein